MYCMESHYLSRTHVILHIELMQTTGKIPRAKSSSRIHGEVQAGGFLLAWHVAVSQHF